MTHVTDASLPSPQHNAYQLILHQHAPNGVSRMPCKTVEEITNVMRFSLGLAISDCTKEVQKIPTNGNNCFLKKFV